MKIKKNSAFTLIETMIALVISSIAVGAIYYSYLFFKNSYQVILDKAAMSDSGRVSLSVISKDLRNAGYKDINFSRAFDRKIEQTDNYNGTDGDSLVIWYNTSPTERLRIRYFLKKYPTGSDMFLAREVVENPTTGSNAKLRHCERYTTQRNCQPQNIVSFVTDFQVVLRDEIGNEITPVCEKDIAPVSNAAPLGRGSCSTAEDDNQEKVHTAEIYLTVRSPNPINKTQKKYRIANADSDRELPPDNYHRETFYISVYLRNILKI